MSILDRAKAAVPTTVVDKVVGRLRDEHLVRMAARPGSAENVAREAQTRLNTLMPFRRPPPQVLSYAEQAGRNVLAPQPNLYENVRTDPLAPALPQQFSRPTTPYTGADLGNVGRTLYEVARTDIPAPIREPIVRGVEEAQRVGPLSAPLAAIDTARRFGAPVPNVRHTVAEVAVPNEVWDTALTLLPAAKARTVPELMAALSVGDVDAMKASRAAAQKFGQSGAMEQVLRRIASETGAVGGKGEPEDLLRAGAEAGEGAVPAAPVSGTTLPPPPESVVRALANRSKVVARDPAELAQKWEVLPAENKKLITAMADAVLSPADRKAITKAGRARQTARSREAIKETVGTTLERAKAGRAALTGRIIPQIEPVGGVFDADEVTRLFAQIDQAFDSRLIIPQEHGTATDAMHLLLYGERPLDPDKPLSLMPHEIKLLGRIYGPEFEAMLPKNARELSLVDKIVDWANLPRAIIAGLDISAPGRQGIMLAARNPVEWGKAWGPMVKSMISEQNYTRELERMQADDYFEDAVLHGLDFTDIGGGAAAEEAFQTRFVQNNVFLRNTIGRGERGYTVYLDKLRLGTYKKGAQRLEHTAAKHGWDEGRLDLAKKDWGGFVNHASGRGDLGALNKYTPTFNALFFSPRFVVSRPQTIYDMVKADPAVRQMVGENLGTFVAGGVSLLAAAAAAGARVELDPRSSDFGKIRLGDQRIEFWGGWQPIARYIAQVATGQRKTLNADEFAPVNRFKTIGRFIRSKLSPAGALGWDLLVEGGKNYQGENFLTLEQAPVEAINRLTPLMIQDAIEGYRQQGAVAAFTAAGVSGVGGGVGTFGASEAEQKAAGRSGAQKALEESGYEEVGQRVFDRLRARGQIKGDYESMEEYRAAALEKIEQRLVERGQSPELAPVLLDDIFPEITLYDRVVSDVRRSMRESDPGLTRTLIEAGIKEPSQADIPALVR